MMRSLSKTLIAGTTVGAACVLVVAGVLLYVLVRASLLAQFDRSLLEKARLFASAVEREDGELDLEFRSLDVREFEGSRPAAYLQLWDPDGSTRYRSAADFSAPRALDPAAAPVYQPVALPDGRDGRAVWISFLPRQEHDGEGEQGEERPQRAAAAQPTARAMTLMLARDAGSIGQTLFRLETALVLVGLVAILASTALLWWVVRRGLRPLERLAAEIAELREQDLSRRIQFESGPAEMQPVVDRLNGLLERLDQAFRRERAFSANVAHELRTPLTGLRLKMDVATSKRRPAHEYEKAIDACRRITGHMETMVENLLRLAQLEAGRVQLRREPVALNDLIRQCWLPLAAEAEARRLQVQWSVAPEALLVSDASQLAVAVRNLLENAVVYADRGGCVRIHAAVGHDAVTIAVANSGSALSQDQAERAFDRFWRGDTARSDAGVHCGLGLSLVRKIASALGGDVDVRSEVGGEFRTTIRLPGRDGQPKALT